MSSSFALICGVIIKSSFVFFDYIIQNIVLQIYE
nr:MAG TPA: hypothetical protein [Caudoviricetes sp.]